MQSDIEKKADIAAKKYAKNKGYGPALQFHVALAYRLGYVDSAIGSRRRIPSLGGGDAEVLQGKGQLRKPLF
jgi:hypothetical protein